jgi:glycosyltransferase involved in cell wall biosynthesis
MMNGKIGHQAYQELTVRLQEIVRRDLPPDATVLVASKGDDELMKLDGRRAWHFPQREDGVYAGYYPSDSAAAIAHLESLQEKGAQFLVLPQTAFWWLDHYNEFGQYLESNYQLVVHDEDTCMIFALREWEPRQRDGEDGAEPVVSYNQFEEPEMSLRDYVDENLVDDLKILFDLDYYREQTGADFPSFDSALIDFLEKGYQKGLNPHVLFDTNYYLDQCPEVKCSGQNPLVHFLLHSVAEDQNPSPYFDTAFYYSLGPGLRQNRVNALVHYLRYASEHKAKRPNPLFANDYYLNTYRDVKNSGLNPLVHYLKHGCAEKRYISHIHRNLVHDLLRSSENSLLRGKWKSGTVLLFSNGASSTNAPIILRIAEALTETYHLNCPVVVFKRDELVSEISSTSNVVILEDFRMACDIFRPSALRMLTKTLCSMKPLFAVCGAQEMLPNLKDNGISSFYLCPDFPDLYSKDILQGILQLADRVIFTSSEEFHSVSKAVGFYPPNVALRPYGFLTSDRSGKSRARTRERLIRSLGLPEDSYIVLGGGTAARREGFDMFLAVARMLRRRRPDMNVAFVWIASTQTPQPSLPYEFSYQDETANSGLEGTVFHVDGQESIDQYLPSADTLLLSSRETPSPSSISRARAEGIPIISFEGTTGVPSASRNGHLVVPYLDVEPVCEKISALYDSGWQKERTPLENANGTSTIEDYAGALVGLAKRDFHLPEDLDSRRSSETTQPTRKVIIPCCDWGVSGVNSSLEVLGKELIDLGWDVEIVFTRDRATILESAGSEEHLPQIPYWYLQPDNPGVEGMWEALISYLESNAPCIMFTAYDFVANGIAPALTNQVGVVSWVQADDGDYYEQTYRLGRYCNAVVCVSERTKNGITELNPLIGDKAQVIYNSSIWEDQILEREPAPGEKMRLVYAGRLTQYQKRVLDFVELANSLDNLGVPYELTLIGEFRARENTRLLFESEAKAHLEDGRIILPGRMTREQILEEFRNHDLFILLSDFEGLPLSLVEAIAQGCVPVVAEMESGIPEVITNGENGFIVSGRDYDQWAALLADLGRDPERLAQLSHQARETVRERFTVEQVGKQFDEFFGRIADEISSGEYRRPPCLRWRLEWSPTGDVLPPPTMYRPPMFGANTHVEALAAMRKSDRERM